MQAAIEHKSFGAGRSRRVGIPASRPTVGSDGERLRLIWVLMLVQAACGLLAALGVIGFALGFAPTPAMAALAAGNLAKNAALVGLAGGIVRRKPFARRAALVLEGLAALAGMASVGIGILPRVETGAGLATMLLAIALPAMLVALLASPATRASFAPYRFEAVALSGPPDVPRPTHDAAGFSPRTPSARMYPVPAPVTLHPGRLPSDLHSRDWSMDGVARTGGGIAPVTASSGAAPTPASPSAGVQQ